MIDHDSSMAALSPLVQHRFKSNIDMERQIPTKPEKIIHSQIKLTNYAHRIKLC